MKYPFRKLLAALLSGVICISMLPLNVMADNEPDPTEIPAPIAEPTPAPTPTPEPTATLTPVPTDTPAPTDTPTSEPTAVLTPVPADTPAPTDTPKPEPTATLTPVPADIPAPTDTPTSEPTAALTPVSTDAQDPTDILTPEPIDNPEEGPTAEPSPTPVETPSDELTTEPSETPETSVSPESTIIPEMVESPETSETSDSTEPSESPDPSETPEPSESPEVHLTGGPESVSYTPGKGASSDDLFKQYVNSLFYPSVKVRSGAKSRGITAGSSLTGITAQLYTILKNQITEVANGSRTSTVFTIDLHELYIDGLPVDEIQWTVEKLGISEIVVDGEISNEAVDALKTVLPLEIGKITDALAADCPYEAYWYDRYTSTRLEGYNYETDGTYLSATGSYTFYFPVVIDYQIDKYTVNPKRVLIAQNAARNATAIVAEYSGYSDLEKLSGYKERIRSLSAYNHEVYEAGLDGTAVYGDPWQLIWVFDGDPSTTVVCEGFSKAFQYLCDLTAFSSSIRCICVTGFLEGTQGAHMWNIVTLDDGRNYMADITNCEIGTGSVFSALFLQKCMSGDIYSGYYFLNSFGGQYKYSYDSLARSMYSDNTLTIANTDYGTPEGYIAAGTCGDSISWFIDYNGVLTLKGTGTTYGYDVSDIPWIQYREQFTKVVIEEGITGIGNGCFEASYKISEITLPHTLSYIGTKAFYGCGDLRDVYYAGTKQEWDAIEIEPRSNFQLVNANIHFAVSDGGICGPDITWTLYKDGELEISGNGEIPEFNDDTQVPWKQYRGQIFSIRCSSGITSIGNYAFFGCNNITDIILPESLTDIGEYAFGNCNNLTELVIPSNVSTIGANAFANCSKLTTLIFENSSNMALRIEVEAFSGCSGLETSVYTIDTEEIAPAITDPDCWAGRVITIYPVSGIIPDVVTRGEVIYTYDEQSDQFTVTGFTSMLPDEVEIVSQIFGKPVTAIADHAFSYRSGLRSIHIPDSVTSIGSHAFLYCHALEEIILPQNIQSLGNSVFWGCYSLKTVIIPYGLKTIPGSAFFECSLESIELPDSITYIGGGAFNECRNLKEIVIPNSVLEIGSGAFSRCSALSSCQLPEGLTAISPSLFSECKSLEELSIPQAVRTIGECAFMYSNIKEVSIPVGVREIGEKAFAYCKKLESVSIPVGVTKIDYMLFYECLSLRSVIIPRGVTEISTSAFSRCFALKNIWLPHTIQSIRIDAFFDCPELELVKYNGVEAIWDSIVFEENNDDLINAPRQYLKCQEVGLEHINADPLHEVIIPATCTSTGLYDEIIYCAICHEELSRGKKTSPITDHIPAEAIRENIIEATVETDGSCEEVILCSSCGKELSRENIIIPRILLATPTLPSAANENGGVRVRWNAVPDAVQYRVLRYSDAGGWVTIVDTSELGCLDTSVVSGTSYSYAVRCLSSSGEFYTSEQSANREIRYIAAPVVSVANATGGIKISWPKVGGAAKYRVFRKAGSGGWAKLGDTTGTSFADKTGKVGTKYSYTVRCISGNGKTYTSSFDAVGKSIVFYKLATPGLPSLSVVNGGVKLSWGKVANAAKYRIFRKTGNGGWAKVADTTGTSYTDKKVSSGATYTYTIRCVTADGKSYASNFNGTGRTVIYISAPVLTASNAYGGVKISWNRVNGAENYRVFRKAGTGGWTAIGDTSELNFLDTTGSIGTKYSYTVRCINAEGTAYTSSFDSKGKAAVYYMLSTPGLPTITRVGGGVKLTWNPVTGAEKYRVFRKTGTGKWVKVADVTGTEYINKGLKKGTKYTYTVRCVNEAGTGYTSNFNNTGRAITY